MSAALPGAVVIAGTLDTKSAEIGFLREELRRRGVEVLVIDCGVLGVSSIDADIGREQVARSGGAELADLRNARNREVAVSTMLRGLEAELRRLMRDKRVGGFIAIGGGTNAALASAAFKILPFGLPKMLVSTVACGNTRPFIGIKDVVLIHSVVDILGLNSFLRGILKQAAGQMTAMLSEASETPQEAGDTHCVGLTSYGSTTPTAERCYARVTADGNECLAFHARGVGGEAMETLIREGKIQSVIDLTTTEIADELVGGICSAGSDRLRAAGEAGIPQVVLPGGVDIVNFGPPATVPQRFADRVFAQHTPHATLMRTSKAENAAIAGFTAGRLNAARGPVAVVLPLGGFSSYSQKGQPFFDPEADEAFRAALQRVLKPEIAVHEIDANINEPAVADLACDLHAAMLAASGHASPKKATA